MSNHAVVLAAGKGTRMKSDLAKVLHPLAGKPLLEHVLSQVRKLDPGTVVVVVGHQAEQVTAVATAFGARTVLQSEQLGTGHAVQQAEPLLGAADGVTVVLSGDVPLLRAETIQRLLDETRRAGAAAGVLTAIAEDPTGYGRILRDSQDHLVGIVEHKDATAAQRAVREYNTGTYCFDNRLLWPALAQVGSDNAQGEFYLTDVIGILVRQDHAVVGVVCPDERETRGVNRPEDLTQVELDLEARRDG
jgi:bifunctional UDP-N-acetylglucosamine pyrophosphorylase/glucosamine-1-phosphate N-acetyltransferase